MEEKKIEIIHAAIRLFSEKGYNSTSVEEIAKESGIAKGSFYKHFHSKEDLLLQIFSLIREHIKKGLTQIYNKNYVSDREKLIDFIYLTIESIISNRIHLLTTICDFPLSKSNEITKEIEHLELKIMTWYKGFFLDFYGEKLEDYVGDLVLFFKGIIFQYVQLFRYIESVIDSKKLAVFIASVLDSVVQGLLERRPEPVFNMEALGWGMQDDPENPRLKGQKIKLLLRQMEHTVKNLKMDSADQKEYLKTISLLKEESACTKPKVFLLKALIHYLQRIPELQADCSALKTLLDVE
ncbi:TetR family transcriptional regulator [Anoxybacillus vitaminiphilus]|uniref:TetR family transcriptional regulator n=1 Tax=Paranoxybacillus vitaminiphilus TaxID=581036 RepID=A0A327Y7Z3_9BACL|nr:TetR/AcrR family transcriptional regulator [Anoxybacillus vitaminiphilus]RAK17160.1 TetR family transcriptional regulator [Anoxybacillus vitaminiphilus]